MKAILDIGLINYDDLDGYKLMLHYPSHVRIWADARRHPLSGEGAENPLSIGTVHNPAARTHTWTIDLNAWDPAELFPLEVFVEGIAISAVAVNWTLYSPGPDGQMLDTDAAKFSVEKIVWPSNETGDAWRSKPTSDWNGFELPEGWYIEKSLEELIQPEADIGYIRTHYPREKTDKVLGDPEGADYTGKMGYTSHSDAPAASTHEYSNGFEMTVEFKFDGPEYVETFQRYVYDDSKTESPSFFQNSGVYIYDHYEVQIYNTDALMKAINAQDFNTFKVNVDGLTNHGIRGDIVNNEVRVYHELDAQQNPNYWTRGEAVSGCISGVPYKVPDVSNDSLGALQAAEQLINGSGSNTMVIQAEPVDPTNEEAGVELTVTLNGTPTWTNPHTVSRTGGGKAPDGADWYVYLQSHWGSGVKFISAQITPLP